jgi:hypothetical protein
MNFAMTRARANRTPVAPEILSFARHGRLVALLTILILATTLHATLTTSALTGRVTVADAPAAGVTISVSSPQLHAPRVATTDARGRYWLGSLPPGVYDVTFSRQGLVSLTRPSEIELARVARADAQLEASDDEESVTSTKTTLGVSDTTAITTHFSSGELDRLPYEHVAAAALAPGLRGRPVFVDGVPVNTPHLLPSELIEQLTVFRGAMPVETDTGSGGIVSVQTRGGVNELFASLRDTYTATGERGNFAEVAAGGRVVPDRLWAFGSVWGGDRPLARDVRGAAVKLTSQPGAAHSLVLTWLGIDSSADPRSDALAAHYIGVAGNSVLGEVIAGDEGGTAVASFAAAGHLLRGGASRRTDLDTTAVFAADRWVLGRWTADAGVRHESLRGTSHSLPRAAITYDLRGDGRTAAFASYGEYAASSASGDVSRVTTLGMATAIGTTGAARIDALRTDSRFTTLDQVQVDSRYRLFDRFEAGATYTWSDFDTSRISVPVPAHAGTAWLGAQLPLGARELGVTFLQRYDFGRWSSDATAWFAVPLPRFGLTVSAGATNLQARDPLILGPRAVRLWARVRI